MSSEPVDPAEEMEPSPFSEDDEPAVSSGRPWKPAVPMTQADLDWHMSRPMEHRTFNPWQCMWNLMAEDGIGYYSGMPALRCSVTLADPTKSRYCLDHARQMGVDYYSPPELAEAVAKETATNLTRLVPKATKVLEDVMDDDEAPQGVRAKAAAEILDRTGYVRGVDVRVEAQIATVDITAVIRDRLDSLKESMTGIDPSVPPTTGAEVVPGEIVDGNDGDADDTPDDGPDSA
jgi:hypothetical protein